jgi:hypothetical protein
LLLDNNSSEFSRFSYNNGSAATFNDHIYCVDWSLNPDTALHAPTSLMSARNVSGYDITVYWTPTITVVENTGVDPPTRTPTNTTTSFDLEVTHDILTVTSISPSDGLVSQSVSL